MPDYDICKAKDQLSREKNKFRLKMAVIGYLLLFTTGKRWVYRPIGNVFELVDNVSQRTYVSASDVECVFGNIKLTRPGIYFRDGSSAERIAEEIAKEHGEWLFKNLRDVIGVDPDF